MAGISPTADSKLLHDAGAIVPLSEALPPEEPQPDVSAIRTTVEEQGSTAACMVLGAALLMIGLCFLVLKPGTTVVEPTSYSGDTHDVVNIQRLALGQTFTVSGVLFLAAALRPRSIVRPYIA